MIHCNCLATEGYISNFRRVYLFKRAVILEQRGVILIRDWKERAWLFGIFRGLILDLNDVWYQIFGSPEQVVEKELED